MSGFELFRTGLTITKITIFEKRTYPPYSILISHDEFAYYHYFTWFVNKIKRSSKPDLQIRPGYSRTSLCVQSTNENLNRYFLYKTGKTIMVEYIGGRFEKCISYFFIETKKNGRIAFSTRHNIYTPPLTLYDLLLYKQCIE